MESKEKVLLVGRWGKTHALAKAIRENPNVELLCFMDKPNAGIVKIAHDYRLGDLENNDEILSYAREKAVDFVVIVPHMTLVKGLADRLNEENIPCVGPSEFCSQLETDKGFARELLSKIGLDVSPEYRIFYDPDSAIDYIKNYKGEFAVKPAGVTEGDGVKVMGIQLENKQEAIEYVSEIFSNNMGGLPRVVIEEKLTGEEFTIQVFTDGKTLHGMPATRDYKLLKEGDAGLNTPGMGSISFPNHILPFLDQKGYDYCMKVMERVILHMTEVHNEPYKGFLSGQFIQTEKGPMVIEFNVRPGDSEILNITPILKTDFMRICHAIYEQRLHEMEIFYEEKATVCKYIVKEGFPYPRGKMHMEIDEEGIAEDGGHLFYSCFSIADKVYKPSPRGVAITAVEDTLEAAWQSCEKLINLYVKGKELYYRRDIGTWKLLSKYQKRIEDDIPKES